VLKQRKFWLGTF